MHKLNEDCQMLRQIPEDYRLYHHLKRSIEAIKDNKSAGQAICFFELAQVNKDQFTADEMQELKRLISPVLEREKLRLEYVKWVEAAKRLADQAADQYVDACDSLVTGFVHTDTGYEMLQELPTRSKYKEDDQRYKDFMIESNPDRESRLNKEKAWVRARILSGEFHQYFDPKKKDALGFDKKYNIYIPQESNKEIFYPTVNAIIASEMLVKLEYKADNNSWTAEDFANHISQTTQLCKQKRDLHEPRNMAERQNIKNTMKRTYENGMHDYKWGRRTTEPEKPTDLPKYVGSTKSYNDCLEEQKQNPVIAILRKLLKGFTSLFTNETTLFSAPGVDAVSNKIEKNATTYRII